MDEEPQTMEKAYRDSNGPVYGKLEGSGCTTSAVGVLVRSLLAPPGHITSGRATEVPIDDVDLAIPAAGTIQTRLPRWEASAFRGPSEFGVERADRLVRIVEVEILKRTDVCLEHALERVGVTDGGVRSHHDFGEIRMSRHDG